MESQTSTAKVNYTTPDSPEAAAPKKKINKRFLIILGVLLIAASTFGIVKYNHAQHHEETDDAQIEASINPVIPRIGGYIAEVHVNDNQRVKEGDTLLVLDNRDLVIRLEQAEAALAGAQSNLNVARATTSALRLIFPPPEQMLVP